MSAESERFIAYKEKTAGVKNMDAHTAISETPDPIKPMVAIAEAFRGSIANHLKKKRRRRG